MNHSDATNDPPILTGPLSLDLVRGRAVLTLTVQCPHCRGPHLHSWGFDPLLPSGTFPTGPTHREPHCWRPRSPYRRPLGTGYLVAPADTSANQRVLDRFVRMTSGAATSRAAATPTTATA